MSKKVWIDHKVKWNPKRKQLLCKQNRYKGHAYIVCSSPEPHLLFEIIDTRLLSSYYQNAVLFALCHTKTQAIEQIRQLIDLKYNHSVG